MTPDQSRKATRAAIRDGLLVRQPCEVCGAEPTHAHHDDYSRPYDVVFLCPKHHRWLHQDGRTVEQMTLSWLAWQAELAMQKHRRALIEWLTETVAA